MPIFKEEVMKRFFQTKRLMSFVCVLFTAILSLCSINIMNYHDLLTTSTQEEVLNDENNENETLSEDLNKENNTETSGGGNSQSPVVDDSQSDDIGEENSQDDNGETNNDNTSDNLNENTENDLNNNDTSPDTSEEDDLDDVVSAKVYYIDSASDLYDMDGSSDTFILRRNISISSWRPIPFYGTLDGRGYTIDITVSSSSGDYAGLFSELSGGSVSNLILSGSVNVTCGYAGGVCGYNAGGTIYNVWNQISVTNNRSMICCAGGITGYNNGSIYDCMNSGTIYALDGYAGGIVGESYADFGDCINFGGVNGYHAGGIVGHYYDRGKVSNCGNYGGVNGDVAGGIAGYFGTSTWNNTPEGKISNCGTSGVICGEADTNITNCWYTGSSPCDEAHDSKITGGGKAKKTSTAVSNATYGFTYLGSAYVRYFVKYIYIYVAVENENGRYTTVSNNSNQYRVGYRAGINGGGSSYYMLASNSPDTIISNIINNSNGAYEYAGIYDSLNGGTLLSAGESSYRELYNEVPSAIYVRFDLNPTEITANVYYSTSFSSDGTFPSNAYSGTTGGEATISAKSSNQTLDIDPKATIETEKGDTITFTMSARSGYELVGLFMAFVNDNGNVTGRTNILAGNSSNVSVDYNGSLSEITYSFKNTNITSGGEMVENYHIVFARYQTYFTISESYTTDREEFVEEFGATVSKTTYVTYGYTSRSLCYKVDRNTSAGFYDDYGRRIYTIELSAGSSSNPFFAGNRAWYVANCDGTSFYWGGEEEFSFNNISNLPNGITAYDSSNPYFEVDLWSYYYGGDMSFSFKEYSVNLDEKRGGETRIYDLYIVDGYEDIQTGEYTYGELGGKTSMNRYGRLLTKTDVKLNNGMISSTGENAKAYSFTNFQVDYYYRFDYNSSSPFKSSFFTGPKYLDEAEKVSNTADQTLMGLGNNITKTNYTGYYDEAEGDTLFTADFGTSDYVDVQDKTILQFIKYMLNLPSDNLGRQNINNNNIVLFAKFAVTSFDLTVKLDQNYLIYQTDSLYYIGKGAPFSVYVNGISQTVQNDDIDKFVIKDISAYSEIEIIINDTYFMDVDDSSYRIYTYYAITSNGTFRSDQEYYRFQIIPEENGASLTYRIDYSLMTSGYIGISSNITKVGNIWYIDEAEDFEYLYYLNMYENEDFSGIRLVQTKNIDFGGQYITSLGTEKTPFKGYYDGQYYTISNFVIGGVINNISNVGFFGYVENAEINNVTLLDGEITGFSNVGGVVGYANNSTLTRLGNYNVKVTSVNRSRSNNIFVWTIDSELVALNEFNVGTGLGQYNVIMDALLQDENGILYQTPAQVSENIGGFAGHVKNSTLNTCFSRGEVDSDATTSAGFVGGTTSCSLSYCYTTLSTFAGSGTIGSHNHATNGKDIVDEVCSTCVDKFIW